MTITVSNFPLCCGAKLLYGFPHDVLDPSKERIKGDIRSKLHYHYCDGKVIYAITTHKQTIAANVLKNVFKAKRRLLKQNGNHSNLSHWIFIAP